VCTANQCRSPIAATLLRRHLAAAGVVATVSSAGTAASTGSPATDLARVVTGSLDGHRSHRLTAEDVREADLVLCMERDHARAIVVEGADALGRTFTLKELVRLGRAVGPRGEAEDVTGWIARAGQGREASDLIGSNPDDDVTDPIGRPLAFYEATHAELDALLSDLVALVWPARSSNSDNEPS
jgi:protein-tyrosine phosphatase